MGVGAALGVIISRLPFLSSCGEVDGSLASKDIRLGIQHHSPEFEGKKNQDASSPLSVLPANVAQHTEVCTESPGHAKTLRIMSYTQIWGRLPKVGFRACPGLSVQTSVSYPEDRERTC